MKNAVFRNVSPCGSCKKRSFGEVYRLIRATRLGELGTTLALRSSRTSVPVPATLRNIPEDGVFCFFFKIMNADS
jgi:hypothetical protein